MTRTATNFSAKFPGLNPHLLTLSSNFQIPVYRDFLMSMGLCSVSMRSCTNILRKGPGSCLTIVIGGAAESLSAHPGTADLTLKRRLGFIKLALREGCARAFVGQGGLSGLIRESQGRPCACLFLWRERRGRIPASARQCADADYGWNIPQIYEQLSNAKGTTLYKLQKRFQAAFGFTLRACTS